MSPCLPSSARRGYSICAMDEDAALTLTGKAALVTGGRRIGAVVARTLGARGMDVAVSYHRSRGEAERVRRGDRGIGRRAVAIAADLSDPQACTTLIDDAASAFGRLDAVIHLASVYVRRRLAATDVAAWDAAMAVDLRAAFLCAQAAIPHLRAAGGGRIVNVSDWVAASGRPRYKGYLPYYVAKRAVIGLSESLALELAADGSSSTPSRPGRSSRLRGARLSTSPRSRPRRRSGVGEAPRPSPGRSSFASNPTS